MYFQQLTGALDLQVICPIRATLKTVMAAKTSRLKSIEWFRLPHAVAKLFISDSLVVTLAE
jgi:hypothetical protein